MQIPWNSSDFHPLSVWTHDFCLMSGLYFTIIFFCSGGQIFPDLASGSLFEGTFLSF